MENRKFVKILFLVVFGFLFFGVKDSLGYGIDTHAFLTKDAIEFYFQKIATSSVNNLTDYLIDGARKEDDVPRWMNHFYDPVYDRGLTMDSKIDPFYVLGDWNKSKDWAANSDLQNEVKYRVPATIASILNVFQQRKLSGLTTETDFTWNEALYFWINGEKEKAMFALGHVLHLVQDASVPDHTRNDPHPEGSIYEKWVGQFTLNNPDNNLLPKLANKNLINFDNLGLYFDELAKYSNDNFYSKDTIGIQSGYDFPEMEGVEKNGDYYYSYKSDGIGNIYYVSVYKNYRGSLVIGTTNNIGLKIEDEDRVVSNYWSLLSPKAVQYSASVMDFFFKEAERLKDDPQFAKRESLFAQVIDVAKGIVSSITNVAKDIVGTVKDSAQIADQNLLASVSLNVNNDVVKKSNQEIIGPSLVTRSIKDNDVETVPTDSLYVSDESYETNKSNIEELLVEEEGLNLEQDVAQEIISSSTQEKLLNEVPEPNIITEPITQNCFFQTNKMPTHQELLINEVAWTGSIKSSSDEWIEIKNISGSELDISNWQILDKEEQIKITFPENTKVLAGGFLLLERTDDNSVPNVKADIIYTGALSNSDEGLRLFNDQCNLVDEALASSEWPAGDSSTKKTMERQTDLGWGTYIGSGEGTGNELILGTPKKENSLRVISYGGGGGSATTAVVVVETINGSNVQPSKLLISEVQITGGTGKSNNDFVEIYNPNESRVNLKGYRLVKRTKTGTTDTSMKSWTDDVYVEAKSFYLWANSDYTDISVIPDITTSGSLANDNGVALRFGAEDTGTIIDSVAWGLAENSFIGVGVFSQNPGAGQSIHRKLQNNLFVDTDNNADDFELTACPNPKAQSRFCEVSETNESNQAPSAFFVFSTTTPKIGEEIIFNAASSTDSDGNIVLYDWNFGDNQLTSSTQATTTHSYSSVGDFDVLLTVFDNLNATSTHALLLSVASSTIQQGIVEQSEELEHVLISEVMAGFGDGRSDEEFIELYNPNLEEINLSGYSLKRRASILSTTTQNLVRSEHFASTTIEASGFLLIASKEYKSSSTPDIYYSNSSYHSAYSDEAIILYDNFNEVVDEIEYESIDEGKSLERMALSNGVCVSAQGGGEFLGNGCNTDNLSDFEIRDIPNPQNKNNFPEPRNKPNATANFIGEYDKINKKINLSWGVSQDYSGATSTLSYFISDISPNPILDSIEIASTTVEFGIVEIGRDYIFEIKAIDKEGLSSDISTTTVSVPSASIEDVNYLLLNQNQILSNAEGSFGQVFKPLAEGVIESATLNLANSIQHGDSYGSSNVSISLYEWTSSSATTSPNIGRGQLLATSSIREFYIGASGNYIWSFDNENQLVLDATKYYYLQVNIVPTHGNLSLIWSLSSASGASDKALYVIIKAVENGSVIVNSPVNNYIYQNIDINFAAKYSEPFKNKYSNLVVDVRDFYTEELVNSQTITLSDNQKTIGWHEITGNLNINRPGYFKLKISLSELSKSEINFSVFGTVPVEDKLLNQTAFLNNSSVNSVAQTFRPMVDGQLDSIILKLSTGGNGWNYTSLKIYEWIGGQLNSLEGSKGQLLATSESKMFWNNSAVGDPVDFTWQFNDENEISLDSDKYYYVETVIDSQSNGGAPGFFFRGSSNDSLIDGKMYTGNIGGDLYIIVNAKSSL